MAEITETAAASSPASADPAPSASKAAPKSLAKTESSIGGKKIFEINKSQTDKTVGAKQAKIAAALEKKFAAVQREAERKEKGSVLKKFKSTPARDEADDTPAAADPLPKTEPSVAEPASAASKTEPAKAEPASAAASGNDELPQEYIRSLKAFGMSDEDIASGYKDSPFTFASMAKMMHAARKKEIAEFANIGRTKQQSAVAAATAPAAAAAPSETAQVVADLKKKYSIAPDNTFLEDLMTSLDAKYNTRLQSYEQALQAQREAQTARTVSKFFADPALAIYTEDYKTPEAKQKVIDLAAQIVNGATQSNRRLTIEEALTMAHDMTMAPKAKTVARQEILQEAKKRQEGMTIRPTGAQKSPAADSRSSSRGELERRIGQKLRAMKKG